MKTGSRSLNQSREALQTKGKVNGRFLVWLFVFSVAANLFLLAMPLYLAQIYDRVLPSSSFETLIYLTAIILVCLALFGVMEVLRSKIAQRLSTHYEMTTAPAILNRSIESRDAIASQQSALLGDVTMIRQLLASRAFIALFDLPFTPLFLLLLFVVHPWLGWVATAGAIMLVTLAICNEALARNRNGQSAQTQQIAKQKGAEILTHLEDVRAMAMGQALYERWRKTALQTALSADQVASLNGFFFGLVRFSRQAIQVAILGTGAYLVLTQSMSAGLIFAASIIGGRALMPIEQLLGSWRQLSSAHQASKRVKNALSFYEQQTTGQNQSLRLPQLKGYLQVSRVSYVPEGLEDDKAILKNINFARHPGSILAILGASGAGKSTLMRILATSQHQSHGAVLFDMFQADHWSVNQLGKSIGYAGQSSDLFEGSVAENIARFDPDATDEDILQAANHAGAHDFIGSLPDGYHTQLGDGSVRLSGGQKQRILLARAFYKDPAILLLDEPNAHLDSGGEKALKKALLEAKARGKTIVFVTQRKGLLSCADDILVLDKGQMSFLGTAEQFAEATKPAKSQNKTKQLLQKTGPKRFQIKQARQVNTSSDSNNAHLATD